MELRVTPHGRAPWEWSTAYEMHKFQNSNRFRNISLSIVATLLQLIAAGTAQIVGMATTATVTIDQSPDSDTPNAIVLSVHKSCEYSEDGVHFSSLGPKQTLTQGAVVRTGGKARMDLFFRRTGTTIRLQADTEVKLERMHRSTANAVPVISTLLDLRKGRIFTIVRSQVAGSTFEIRNAAGRSVVEGATGAMGRYIITADGTQIAHKTSTLPLKLIDAKGITIIRPGEKFDAKEGKQFPVDTPNEVLSLIEFDELSAMTDAMNVEGAGAEAPNTRKD